MEPIKYEEDIIESITDLNRDIHQWDAHKKGPKDFPVYKYKDIYVEYHCEDQEKEDDHHCLYQMDEIRIYKNKELIKTHKPHLDPYVSYDKHILVLSSDGEIWVYDLENNKELTYPQGIVAFYQSVEVEEAEYRTEGNTRVPVKEDRIWISGDGCVWGCESDDIYFNLFLDYDLNVIKYNEDYGSTDYDARDDYDSEYVYFFIDGDFVRMPRQDHFNYTLDPEAVEIYVIPTDNREPYFEHNDKVKDILDHNNLLQNDDMYDSLSEAQYWASRD